MDPREGMGVRGLNGTDEPEPTKEGNVARYPTFHAHMVHGAASEFRALGWKRDDDHKIVGPPTDRRSLQVFCQKIVLASKSSGNGHQFQVSMLTYARIHMLMVALKLVDSRSLTRTNSYKQDVNAMYSKDKNLPMYSKDKNLRRYVSVYVCV